MTWRFRDCRGLQRKKKTPEKPGPQSGRKGYRLDRRDRGYSSRPRYQSPKYGRSPLRMAIRACAIKRRSIEAIKRPNRVLAGVRRRARLKALGDQGFGVQRPTTRPRLSSPHHRIPHMSQTCSGREFARFGRIDEWHVEVHNSLALFDLSRIPGRSHKMDIHL